MIDAPTVLQTYLLSKTALTTLTGTRIWKEHTTPPVGYKPSQGSAICFRARGGSVDYSRAMVSNSWQFKCYGDSVGSANVLYRTLFNVLDDTKGAGIHMALLEIAGQTLIESPSAGLEWPYVLCFYETMMLAQAA